MLRSFFLCAIGLGTLWLRVSTALESPIDAKSPFDHSWITKWAAVGDSYAAGLGAGPILEAGDGLQLNPGGFFAGFCHQYTDGYPNIVNDGSNLGPGPRVFQYLPCSGALAANILTDQVPLLDSPQMVTLSAGGNDADLANILNWCIYEWLAPSSWNTCDNVLRHSQDSINSDSYLKDLTDMIDGILAKLASGTTSRVYWLGYAKFFDVSTRDCDKSTWTIPRASGYQYLTLERRKAINDLVDLVNDKIKSVVAKAGSRVIFVDWQPTMDTILGRYCEAGVDESWDFSQPVGHAMNREETVFYEWATNKDDDDIFSYPDPHRDILKRDDSTPPITSEAGNATFEGAIANFITAGAKLLPDVYKNASGELGINITGGLLPNAYGRIFHVTKYGNNIMAKQIVDAITNEQARMMSQPAITTTITPVGEQVAAATPSPPTGKQCHGVSGNQWILSRDVAVANITAFCQQTSASVEYNKGTANDLHLSLSNSQQPTAPISAAPDCVNTFVNNLIDGCDGNDPVNNPHNYKFGGNFTTPDAWIFQMDPLFTQVDEDACSVTYEILDDAFQIQGKNFPDSKLGVTGEGLLDNLRHCGVVSDWTFTLTPQDPKYQWLATGETIIGKKSCIGDAIQAAGGSTNGGCEGAG